MIQNEGWQKLWQVLAPPLPIPPPMARDSPLCLGHSTLSQVKRTDFLRLCGRRGSGITQNGLKSWLWGLQPPAVWLAEILWVLQASSSSLEGTRYIIFEDTYFKKPSSTENAWSGMLIRSQSWCCAFVHIRSNPCCTGTGSLRTPSEQAGGRGLCSHCT